MLYVQTREYQVLTVAERTGRSFTIPFPFQQRCQQLQCPLECYRNTPCKERTLENMVFQTERRKQRGPHESQRSDW